MGNKEQLRRSGKGDALLKFIKKTKDGEYSEIDKDIMSKTRPEQRTIMTSSQDDFYYYGIS